MQPCCWLIRSTYALRYEADVLRLEEASRTHTTWALLAAAVFGIHSAEHEAHVSALSNSGCAALRPDALFVSPKTAAKMPLRELRP